MTRNERQWAREFRKAAIRDQALSRDYAALARSLRRAGEFERAGWWQNVAASYAACARNSLTHLLNVEA